MTTALLLIDIQNDYFPGGKMELMNMEKTAAQAICALTLFRTQQLPIYHIQHLSIREGANFFVEGTCGANINEMVLPLTSETVIKKNYPNSFRETSLLTILQQSKIQHLVIAGAMSHMCIDSTTRAAFDYGFKCTVVEDACTTRDLILNEKIIPAEQVHASFMAALGSIFAKITSSSSLTKLVTEVRCE